MSSSQQDLSFLKINRDEKPADRNRSLWIGSGTGVLVLAAAVWFFTASGTVHEVETGLAVVSTPAQESSILVSSGYIVAQRKAAVASKGTGRLEALYVIEGDRVQQGQVLGRIESQDVEAALQQARANLKMAEASVLTAETERDESGLALERAESLFQRNLISKSEIESARFRNRRAASAWESAKASVDMGQAGVHSAEVAVENTNIRAPFTGVVLTKNANVGEVISPFGAASGSRGNVVTMADMTSLEVEAEVSESNIQKITEGQPCEIMLDAYPSVRYPGFVNKIVPTADRAKATVLTKVRFRTTDEKVLPEMRAKVSFMNEKASADTVKETPRLTVPVSAILSDEGGKFVFAVKGDKAVKTGVTLGSTFGTRTEILSGLVSGDRVVLRPGEEIKDGDLVTAKKD